MLQRKGQPPRRHARFPTGVRLLHDPTLNQGTAFTEDERERLNGEVAEFVFFVRNPMAGQIAWKARQRLADGTSADWIGVEGDRRPASVTRLTAAR